MSIRYVLFTLRILQSLESAIVVVVCIAVNIGFVAVSRAQVTFVSSRTSVCKFYITSFSSSGERSRDTEETLRLLIDSMAANNVTDVILQQMSNTDDSGKTLNELTAYLSRNLSGLKYTEVHVLDRTDFRPGVSVDICDKGPQYFPDILNERSRIKSVAFRMDEVTLSIPINYLTEEFQYDIPEQVVRSSRVIIKAHLDTGVLDKKVIIRPCSLSRDAECESIVLTISKINKRWGLFAFGEIDPDAYRFRRLAGLIRLGLPIGLSQSRGIVAISDDLNSLSAGVCVSHEPHSVQDWGNALLLLKNSVTAICKIIIKPNPKDYIILLNVDISQAFIPLKSSKMISEAIASVVTTIPSQRTTASP